MSNTTHNPLLIKLDEFVRKYYKNQLLRGAVYFVLAISIAWLIGLLLEYFGQYGTTARTVIFYALFTFSVYCLIRFVVIPLAGMYKLGATLSYEQASTLIGRHFPEVKDKLVNTLQLQRVAGSEQSALLEAAIQQKVEQLKPIPFAEAVNLKPNLKKARLLLIPIGVYLCLYFLSPGILTSAGERLFHHRQVYIPQAPFTFTVENAKLETPQFSDFELKLALSGNSIPNEVWVEANGQSFKMQKLDGLHFSYTFRNINKNIPFVFRAASFQSNEYVLKVIDKPALIAYQVKLHYPSYLHQADEVIQNPGDLSIPCGTQVTWNFTAEKTDEVLLSFGGKEEASDTKNKQSFTLSKRFLLSVPYTIKSKNSSYGVADSLAYMIQVVPDAYPTITIDEKADSVTGKQLFFIGDAGDDYGLTKLVFAYRYVKSEDETKQKIGLQTKPIALDRNEKTQRFYYTINLNEIGVAAADEVEYFFEVWDNDGVRGAKSTKSRSNVFKAPSEKELRKEMDMAGKSLKEELKEAINDAKKLQKELKDLQTKMLEKRELTWEEKKKAEELMARQKELLQKIDDIKNQNQKNNQREQEFKEPNPELMEKQQQLEKLFNEVMNEEMKKLLKEMERMLQQQNKDAMKQEMEKMQLNNKDVEKELDRMLEQYKQLELDKKLTDATKQLEKLAEKQKELAKQTEQLEQNKNLSKQEKQQQAEQLKQQQQQLQQEFKDVQQQLKDVEQKNETMETPRELADTKKEEQKANESMEKAKENLSKGNEKESKQNQEDAAKEMEEMAEKMKEKQEEAEKEQHEEDAAALREILENTIQLSKDQEQLMDQMKQISGYSPQFVELAKQQKITRDNAKIIEDSLLALSKRVPEISSFINREVTKLNDNLDKSVTGFGQRNFMEIRTRQQYAMTHANNLAVMLSQVLNQMQQQSQKSKPKSGQKGKGKPKPGQGSGSKPLTMSQIKKMQEELNKQLREGMNKQGNQGKPKEQGGQKPGGQQQGGQQGMGSEGFARMAAQQMAIRQQLQRMMNQMDAKQKEGLGGSKLLEEMKRMMEQTEKELFNKRMTTEMMQRQQDIMTRLLESEKAERKQEQEQKREAEQAKEKPKAVPPAFEQYIEQRSKEKELLETIPAEMQPYYREKVKQYFNRIGTKG